MTCVASGVLFYLEPFVIGEEAEWHKRITHEEPVDKLLNYIDEGIEPAVGQVCQQGTIPYKCLALSHKHTKSIQQKNGRSIN